MALDTQITVRCRCGLYLRAIGIDPAYMFRLAETWAKHHHIEEDQWPTQNP